MKDAICYDPPDLEEYYDIAKRLATKAYYALLDRMRSLLEVDDLTHAGIVRLINDIRKTGFDPARSKFSTYAYGRISFGILDLLRKWREVPQKPWEKLRRVLKKREELTQRLKREPGLEEWAEYVSMAETNLVEILRWDIDVVSIDGSEPREEGRQAFQEPVAPPADMDDPVQLAKAAEEINYYVNARLSEFERVLYRLRLKMTLEDAAEMLRFWFSDTPNLTGKQVWAFQQQIETGIKVHLSVNGWPEDEIDELFAKGR